MGRLVTGTARPLDRAAEGTLAFRSHRTPAPDATRAALAADDAGGARARASRLRPLAEHGCRQARGDACAVPRDARHDARAAHGAETTMARDDPRATPGVGAGADA